MVNERMLRGEYQRLDGQVKIDLAWISHKPKLLHAFDSDNSQEEKGRGEGW